MSTPLTDTLKHELMEACRVSGVAMRDCEGFKVLERFRAMEEATQRLETTQRVLREGLEAAEAFQLQICGSAMAIAHGEPEKHVWDTIDAMGPLMSSTTRILRDISLAAPVPAETHARVLEELRLCRANAAAWEAAARDQGCTGPCGHSAQYAFTPDGAGKTILCYVCLWKKAEKLADDLVKALRSLKVNGQPVIYLDLKLREAVAAVNDHARQLIQYEFPPEEPEHDIPRSYFSCKCGWQGWRVWPDASDNWCNRCGENMLPAIPPLKEVPDDQA